MSQDYGYSALDNQCDDNLSSGEELEGSDDVFFQQVRNPSNHRKSAWRFLVGPSTVVCVLLACTMAQFPALGLRLDGSFKGLYSSASVFVWIGAAISFIYLGLRIFALIRGRKMQDHLDSKINLAFWMSCCFSFTLFAGLVCAKADGYISSSYHVVMMPLYVFFGAAIAGMAFYVGIYRAKSPMARTMAGLCSVVLILVASTLATVAEKMNGGSQSWNRAFGPFWVLCALPVLGPIMGCIAIYLTGNGGRGMWDYTREDHAEGIVFTVWGVVLALLVVPPMFSVIMTTSAFSHGLKPSSWLKVLLPVIIQCFIFFVISVFICVRQYKRAREQRNASVLPL